MKILILIFFLAFCGCASKPIVKVQTKEVYIPIKCNVEKPLRPNKKESLVENVKSMAIYTEKLENALNACVKE